MKLLTLLTLTFALAAFAETTKLEGEAKCGKCHLKTTPSCHAAVAVKVADGKETIYYAEKDEKGKALHDEICQTPKPVTLEGTTSEKDGKMMVKIVKFELKK